MEILEQRFTGIATLSRHYPHQIAQQTVHTEGHGEHQKWCRNGIDRISDESHGAGEVHDPLKKALRVNLQRAMVSTSRPSKRAAFTISLADTQEGGQQKNSQEKPVGDNNIKGLTAAVKAQDKAKRNTENINGNER